MNTLLTIVTTLVALCAPGAAFQSKPTAVRPPAASYRPPEFAQLLKGELPDLRNLLERYQADEESLISFYDLPISAAALERKHDFYSAWRRAIENLDFARMGVDARIEYVLFRNLLDRNLRDVELTRKRVAEISALLPFAPSIIALKEARQRVDPLEPRAAAEQLDRVEKQAGELVKWLEAPKPERVDVKPTVAMRAVRTIASLREHLKEWYAFYNAYDPLFTWWVAEPYNKLDKRLSRYSDLIREKIAGLKADDRDTIIGDPIGAEALMSELTAEIIPYTPEQLVEIANREFAWCDAEMLKASRELGFGDDWKRALEHVKTLHVPPGQQPALILEQAIEAIDFVEKHDLVTVPPLARDTWRMKMMSPERQRINPFFLGGEAITVSYPTDSMPHEQKLMSMRGNNIHFSRATVHHELIPGHNLQRFMNLRYRPYRRVFDTPFWGEGWALYWEMLLWDLQFPKTPENRIGMLFWRMHRCARIIFSLSFHLEKMTAQQCVDFLVNRVGHERENAAAEVRRSFETDYSPLYQSAYMLGGLQFRALHKELVQSGRMTNRAFHDAILMMNSIPIEMVRASLLKQQIAKDYKASWRFYSDIR